MLRRIFISSAILSAVSFPALAQNNDAALQEEIRKVRAYNSQTNIGATGSPYQGAKIKLLAKPSTEITYVSTPAQQAPDTATAPRPSVTYTRIHRIVEGDTLYNLAKRNCMTVMDIQNHNAMGGNNIRIGQVLALPVSKCVSATPAVVVPTPATMKMRTESRVVRQVMPIQTGIKVQTGNAYAVLPKDSLYSIGRRYCVSAGELAGFNNIDATTPIQPGQILHLPKKACK